MRFLSVLVLFFLLAACTPAAVPQVTVPAAPQAESATTAATDVPAAAVAATLAPTQFSSGEFDLILYSPADGDVVAQPQVELKGRTSIETVMTVNSEIHILAGGQDFILLIPLEEGPNLIEIVASDYSGNEIDIILTVTYQPED
jgi:photosystem II stability/assembly factor-like uncharacterized protein